MIDFRSDLRMCKQGDSRKRPAPQGADNPPEMKHAAILNVRLPRQKDP
jgi:hypothetical protein